ncbi:hypothetical protein FH972_022848 [Carpinus fangiana]|uniref:Uncharacterized protein n=1 Tax=Carpinus fangiana TaxID=176857 RepID=A0A5N6KTR6_9ROSI|nr:hypothetical protein FH972_022848 [Carpinus fangiana]
MERPPIRRELINPRMRRNPDDHLRRHTRHAHANRSNNDISRLNQRQDSSATSQMSHQDTTLSSRDTTTPRDTSHASPADPAQSSTAPIAQIILSAALFKSSADAAAAPTSIGSTSAPPPASPAPTDTRPGGASVASALSVAPASANSGSTALPNVASSTPSTASPSSLTVGSSIANSTSTIISSSTSTVTTPSTTTSSRGSSTPSGEVFAADFSSQTTSSSSIARASQQISVAATSIPTSSEAAPIAATPSAQGSATSQTNAPGASGAYGLGGSATETNAPGLTQNSQSQDSVPTPTVVGSVIGGVAGLSLILVILLFVFRRLKKKRKYDAAQQTIPGDDINASRSIDPPGGVHSGGPLAGVSAVAGSMARRLSRQSRPASIEAQTPPMTERGFERVSGRKLPSQFSPGVQGPAGATVYPSGSTMRYPSGSSHYPSGATASSAAFADDPFADSPFSDPPASPRSPTNTSSARRHLGDFTPIQPGQEVYQTGPGRTPTIHQVPNTPNFSMPHLVAPGASPLLRSATPDSRGSRFQEDFV